MQYFSLQLPDFLLDHALKVDLLKLMFSFHGCPFCPTSTTLVKNFLPVGHGIPPRHVLGLKAHILS